MELYVIRHQESEANAKGILQGIKYDTPLSAKGIEKSIQLGHNLESLLQGKLVRLIKTSPLKRSTQTAEIIGEILDVPVVKNDSLIEFDTGILYGPKKELIKRIPEYLSIYHARGDLDGIPTAETGNELQARAIGFLAEYFHAPKETIDIVVSHAGFNRCMLNTAKGNIRSMPINFNHGAIHILKDPWENIDYKFMRALNSESYRIDTANQKYVLKFMKDKHINDMKFQNKVSDFVNNQGNLISRVLHWHMDYTSTAIQVLNYFEGVHKPTGISLREKQNLIKVSYSLEQALTQCPNFYDLYPVNLKDKLWNTVKKLEDSPLKKFGKKLLTAPRFVELLHEEYLSHYDLHEANILFTPEQESRILDLGSIIYAPKHFLPACLYISFFHFNYNDTLEEFLDAWPENLNPENVKLLVGARALIGTAFFQNYIRKGINVTEEIKGLYKNYMNGIERIDREIEVCNYE